MLVSYLLQKLQCTKAGMWFWIDSFILVPDPILPYQYIKYINDKLEVYLMWLYTFMLVTFIPFTSYTKKLIFYIVVIFFSNETKISFKFAANLACNSKNIHFPKYKSK